MDNFRNIFRNRFGGRREKPLEEGLEHSLRPFSQETLTHLAGLPQAIVHDSHYLSASDLLNSMFEHSDENDQKILEEFLDDLMSYFITLRLIKRIMERERYMFIGIPCFRILKLVQTSHR